MKNHKKSTELFAKFRYKVLYFQINVVHLQQKITFTALPSTIDANTNEQIYRKSYERGSGSPLVVRLSCFLYYG